MGMISERASDLIAALDQEWEVRSYSGRGMFGEQCVGVSLESDRDLVRLGAVLHAE